MALLDILLGRGGVVHRHCRSLKQCASSWPGSILARPGRALSGPSAMQHCHGQPQGLSKLGDQVSTFRRRIGSAIWQQEYISIAFRCCSHMSPYMSLYRRAYNCIQGLCHHHQPSALCPHDTECTQTDIITPRKIHLECCLTCIPAMGEILLQYHVPGCAATAHIWGRRALTLLCFMRPAENFCRIKRHRMWAQILVWYTDGRRLARYVPLVVRLSGWSLYARHMVQGKGSQWLRPRVPARYLHQSRTLTRAAFGLPRFTCCLHCQCCTNGRHAHLAVEAKLR